MNPGVREGVVVWFMRLHGTKKMIGSVVYAPADCHAGAGGGSGDGGVGVFCATHTRAVPRTHALTYQLVPPARLRYIECAEGRWHTSRNRCGSG